MKILMLTPYLPYPPSSGGQVRSYNLIKYLSRKHDIYLVSLIKNGEEKRYEKHLLKYCSEIYSCKRSETPWTPNNILKSVFGKYPFLVVRNYSHEAQQVIDYLLKRTSFDLIHAETFYIMPHIPQTKTPILLVEQTIEYKVYQHFVKQLPIPLIRPFFYFDIFKLRHWEKTFWKRADLVGAVSKQDERNMLDLIPNLKTTVIPNAAGDDLLNVYSENKRIAKPVFLYQGNFAWLQNVEAARILIRDIFPQIRKKLPEAECIIAGQKANKKIGKISKHGIRIIDIAPSDTQTTLDIYKKTSIFIAPIEGPGGTRLKVLGAMAAGLPVISSETGISGLTVTDKKNILIARSADDFVQLSITLLNDPKLYNRIKKEARQLIEKKYNWNVVSIQLEKNYNEMKVDHKNDV